MNTSRYAILMILAIIALIAGVQFFFGRPPVSNGPETGQVPSATTSAPALQTVSTPEITFAVPEDFGLATAPDQVLDQGVIPSCDPSFDYCAYFNGRQYDKTNFETAGVRIEKREDLADAQACLGTQPDGYQDLVPAVTDAPGYRLALFSPIGDAGAGHMASGDLYRLSFAGGCYEFEARIGSTQFLNYPAGTISEFTDADRNALRARLKGVLNSVRLSTGEAVTF